MRPVPRLLMVSHVLPFPRAAGQQQRVFYTLKALQRSFHVTFLASVPANQEDGVREKLLDLCDDVILIPSRHPAPRIGRLAYRAAALPYMLRTGLKYSNYLIGQVELSPARVDSAVASRKFDCALFQYWHAVDSARPLQERQIPCVLDMHNVLWQSYAQRLEESALVPSWWKGWALDQYRRREEEAWSRFNAVIAINRAEYEYTRCRVPETTEVLYAAMGTDLGQWPYCWQPADPPRVAYYGGFSSPHNQQAALRCYQSVMPRVWEQVPSAELWLIGSHPPAPLRALEQDPRVHVTGYVESVQEILKTVSLVLCPWSGTYGFRSRLIEVMALGVPVVTTPDAVYGMDMEPGRGLFLEETDDRLAEACRKLLLQPSLAARQSQLARAQMEEKYSFNATYEKLNNDLLAFLGK
jgi:polysaccharide biosynthesis protein PslH